MINRDKLNEVLVDYKEDFIPKHWEEESYKWEAIKGFTDNWDIHAENFPDMLYNSLKPADNLLVSVNYFPRKMIRELAECNPEAVRGMFINLFDETKDVYDRIKAFKDKADIVLKSGKRLNMSRASRIIKTRIQSLHIFG